MINSISIDLDGTLLNDKKEISERDIKCLQELLKKKVLIIIASGRHFKEIEQYVAIIGLQTGYVVSSDGLYVSKCNGSRIYEGNYLPLEDLKRIEKICSIDEYTVITDIKNIYVTKSIEKHLKVLLINLFRFIKRKRSYDKVVLNSSYIDNKARIEKVLFNDTLSLETITELRKNYVVHFAGNGIEVTNKNVTKYDALKWLNDHRLIDINSLLYFGDDYNDIECFEQLPNTIAMENAVEAIKEKAKYITTSNNCNGVSNGISYYFTIDSDR